MDIAEFKKYALPNIEAGKMVNLVRRTIKEAQYSKQDVDEKQKEIYKPIIEKLEKEAKDISDLRKALAPTEEELKALPAAPEQEALPAPEPEQEARPISNLDAGFSNKELATVMYSVFFIHEVLD